MKARQLLDSHMSRCVCAVALNCFTIALAISLNFSSVLRCALRRNSRRGRRCPSENIRGHEVLATCLTHLSGHRSVRIFWYFICYRFALTRTVSVPSSPPFALGCFDYLSCRRSTTTNPPSGHRGCASCRGCACAHPCGRSSVFPVEFPVQSPARV